LTDIFPRGSCDFAEDPKKVVLSFAVFVAGTYLRRTSLHSIPRAPPYQISVNPTISWNTNRKRSKTAAQCVGGEVSERLRINRERCRLRVQAHRARKKARQLAEEAAEGITPSVSHEQFYPHGQF
jgi:hypothetical protein